jgi:hypothetical protein
MTKKVSRKKRDNKTKRRTRAGTRSRGSRRTRNMPTRVKRGGMHVVRRSVQNTAREYFYGTVLPLLQTYDNHVVGRNPRPSDGSVVKYGERYYSTFADIPIDEGTKEIINNLKRELKDLKDPVKNFDKINSVYDKVISKLEEEKRQQDKENGGKSNPITASTFSQSPFSSVPPFSLQQKGSQGRERVGALSKIMSQPFGTPNTDKYPDYSSGSVTPAKPRPKGTIGEVVDDDHDDDDDDDRTAQVLFGVETPQPSPMRSPPLPSSTNPSGPENKENKENELLTSPVRNLRF